MPRFGGYKEFQKYDKYLSQAKLVHYIIFELCSIISLQSCWNIKDCNTFLNVPSIFFIVQQDYSSIFDKWYTIAKIHLDSSDISCLDNVKHISQNRNYGSLFIFCFAILLFELDKDEPLDFSSSLRFALVFFWVPLTK